MIKNLIICGIDRLGKDTLVRGVQDKLGHFQVIHYQKPLRLDCLVQEHGEKIALKRYQEKSFTGLMKLLSGDGPRIIANRAHLGETVYAKRYRGYDGEYVFALEKQYPPESTLLVLLTTSAFDFITDDGESLDVTQREAEQQDFITAFNCSAIKNKLMLDVHDGAGGFKPAKQLCEMVCDAMS